MDMYTKYSGIYPEHTRSSSSTYSEYYYYYYYSVLRTLNHTPYIQPRGYQGVNYHDYTTLLPAYHGIGAWIEHSSGELGETDQELV